MSSLMKKVELHVEQEYPAEFDEKWVNQLLTDKSKVEPSSSSKPQTINHEKELLRDIARVDAELRKQRLIRKIKQVNAPRKARSLPKQVKERSLSAIEKQKIAYEIKSKTKDIEPEVQTPKKPQKKRMLSRLKKR